MMLKVILVCLAATTVVVAQNTTSQQDTRIFGLGNILSGLTGGRPNRPFRPNRPNRPFRPNRPNRPFNQGFNQGFNPGFNQGFNPGFNQGFNPGFNQGFNPGFNQGFNPGFNQGFNQGGFNQGGFSQLGGLIGGLAGSLISGGQSFNQFKPGQCPPVRQTCPDTRFFAPPQPCNRDFQCTNSDKCCFDTCLRERVCKPISQFGK